MMPMTTDIARTDRLRILAETSSLNSRLPIRLGIRSDFTELRTAKRLRNANVLATRNAAVRSSAISVTGVITGLVAFLLSAATGISAAQGLTIVFGVIFALIALIGGGIGAAVYYNKAVRDALSPASVRNLAPGRYADGNGLYLLVTDSGARMWIWRGVIQGRRRELGLGSTSFVALKDARETARQWKRIAHEGGDPAAHRDRDTAPVDAATASTAPLPGRTDAVGSGLVADRTPYGVHSPGRRARLHLGA